MAPSSALLARAGSALSSQRNAGRSFHEEPKLTPKMHARPRRLAQLVFRCRGPTSRTNRFQMERKTSLAAEHRRTHINARNLPLTFFADKTQKTRNGVSSLVKEVMVQFFAIGSLENAELLKTFYEREYQNRSEKARLYFFKS